jgi:hypothetical protein
VNIFLIPYTWFRHIHVAIVTSAAALLAWWLVLSWFVLWGPAWSAKWDGAVLLGFISAATAGASLLAEGSLERAPLKRLAGSVVLAVVVSALLTAGGVRAWEAIITSVAAGEDAPDPTLISLRYELGAFVAGGLACGVGALAARRGRDWLEHLLSGVATGLAAGAVWHTLNHYQNALVPGHDLYLASACMAMTWGGTFGLLAWGIPDRLYTGWLRVLTASRFGRRIPIDDRERSPEERFVGHFPRGLDLWIGAEEGVQELHLSVAVDAEQRYTARGLSLYPTRVRRFLEKIDLRYDPRRPTPLKTRLHSGDRVELSNGREGCVVEFIMLPREEK